jgi:hypothetical protein
VALFHTHLPAPIYRRNKIPALRNYKMAIFTAKKHTKRKNEQKNKPTIVQSADMVTLPKRFTGTTASIVLPVAYLRNAQFLYGCPYRRLDSNMTKESELNSSYRLGLLSGLPYHLGGGVLTLYTGRAARKSLPAVTVHTANLTPPFFLKSCRY